MKINKKALFFDIDGTLFSEKLRQVPQSAVLALKKTMEKGNLTLKKNNGKGKFDIY